MSKRTIVRSPAKKDDKKMLQRKSAPADAEAALVQQLYILSERWQSDLLFFHDEIAFLKKLIDRYLMWLMDEENVESARGLVSDLAKGEKRRFTILQKLEDHGRHLANLIENPFSHDAQECRDEHAEMEALVAGFAKEFRQTKKEVFALIETVIDSEKARYLLNG